MNKISKSSLLVSLLIISGSVFAAAPAQVPATGEAAGGAVGATNGVAWPSPRFVAGTGAAADCITDKLTGLMWAKSPSLSTYTWAKALIKDSTTGGAIPATKCGYSDWRLPNLVELKSLINYGQSTPATWLNNQGFSNVRGNGYWSSSTYAPNKANAWYVSFSGGNLLVATNGSLYYVLPVRGGM